MNEKLEIIFNQIIFDAKKNISLGEYDAAFLLLEKAHWTALCCSTYYHSFLYAEDWHS